MAASAWAFYNEAKKYIGSATINLSTATAFSMALFSTSSNADTATLSTIGSVTNQVASGNGYSSSGKALSTSWASGASASEWRFTMDAVVWTAAVGNISAIRYAVIYQESDGKLLCRSALSTSQFSVTPGNTLTVSPSANGVFELN
jgi:hypothetical protein